MQCEILALEEERSLPEEPHEGVDQQVVELGNVTSTKVENACRVNGRHREG